MKALSFCVVDEVLVSGLADEAPNDDEWKAYLQAYLAMGGGSRKVLVFTQGAGPTTAQRARLNQVLAGTSQRTAVVTASQLGRLMTAAVSWTNPAIRAFAPEHVACAFDCLGIEAPRRPRLIQTGDACWGTWGRASRCPTPRAVADALRPGEGAACSREWR